LKQIEKEMDMFFGDYTIISKANSFAQC
jgi:hypothetical protein